MCMITYLPPNVKVPVSGILNGGSWNDDGHGWAVAAETGHMVTGRSMVLEDSLEDFQEARESFPEAPAMFHSRWATHGLTNVSNVHPFTVAGKAHAGNVTVAHNGVLPTSFHPTKKDTRSDTRIMADSWLGLQSKGTWSKRERRRIGQLIGIGNKLAILSVSPLLPKPKGFLVNGSRGEWVKGAWFSNGDHNHYWTRGYKWASAPTTQSVYAGVFKGERDECPFCFSRDHLDHEAGFCTCCDTCLDCCESLDDCLCHYAASNKGSKSSLDMELTRDDVMQAVCLKCGESALGDCDCTDMVTGMSDAETASKAVERYVNGGWMSEHQS